MTKKHIIIGATFGIGRALFENYAAGAAKRGFG